MTTDAEISRTITDDDLRSRTRTASAAVRERLGTRPLRGTAATLVVLWRSLRRALSGAA